MGQARQRGTFEQRKAAAIARDREDMHEWLQDNAPGNKLVKMNIGGSHVLTTALIAASMGMAGMVARRGGF